MVLSNSFLTFHAAFINGSSRLDVVDIYNAATDEWTVESLVIPRAAMAATTLPRQGLVLFAGGRGLYVCGTSC
jgi:hypothetical protein